MQARVLFFIGCLGAMAGCSDGSEDQADAAISTDDGGGAADAMSQDGQPDAMNTDAGQTQGLCAEPGAIGNSKGIGKYCTVGGNECEGTDAPFCTVDFEASADPFCTTVCFSPTGCGEDASCETQDGQSGCVPQCILD